MQASGEYIRSMQNFSEIKTGFWGIFSSLTLGDIPEKRMLLVSIFPSTSPVPNQLLRLLLSPCIVCFLSGHRTLIFVFTYIGDIETAYLEWISVDSYGRIINCSNWIFLSLFHPCVIFFLCALSFPYLKNYKGQHHILSCTLVLLFISQITESCLHRWSAYLCWMNWTVKTFP